MATKLVTVGSDLRPPSGGWSGSNYTVRADARSVTTVDDTDTPYAVGTDESVLIVDTQAGVCTLTLPAVAACPGKVITVKRAGTGVNAITIDPAGAELIDGGATYAALDAQDDVATFVSDGIAGWILLHANLA